MSKIREDFTKNGKNFLAVTIIITTVLLIALIYIGIQKDINDKSLETSQDLKIEKNKDLQANKQVTEKNTNNEKKENIVAKNEENVEKKADEKKKDEKEKSEKDKKNEEGTTTYYIKVNYGAQAVTVYTKDSDGKYTKPVRAMICSTGTYTPTSGVYKTLAKGNWWGLYGDVYGQYATRIVGGILFHSVPYLTSGDRSSLEYWAYDQLGSRVSMGCVRLTVADAKWIYDNCKIGTPVEFYSSSNPGPLGKPSARKISNAPKNVRGWDPTDPNKNNPWPEYLKSLEKKEDKNNSNNKPTNNNNNNNNKPTNSNNNNNTNTTNNNTVVNEVVNNVTNEEVEENTEIETNEIENSIINESQNEIV